jgi:hypothetical protein
MGRYGGTKGLHGAPMIMGAVGTYLIFVLAMVQIICFAWVFGIDRGWRALHQGRPSRCLRSSRW